MSSPQVFPSETKFGVRCTAVGRIVYDKRRKSFSWRDVQRIVTALPEAAPDDAGAIFLVWVSVSDKLGELLVGNFTETAGAFRSIVLALIPQLLEQISELVSAAATWAPASARRALNRFLDRIFPSRGT